MLQLASSLCGPHTSAVAAGTNCITSPTGLHTHTHTHTHTRTHNTHTRTHTHTHTSEAAAACCAASSSLSMSTSSMCDAPANTLLQTQQCAGKSTTLCSKLQYGRAYYDVCLQLHHTLMRCTVLTSHVLQFDLKTVHRVNVRCTCIHIIANTS